MQEGRQGFFLGEHLLFSAEYSRLLRLEDVLAMPLQILQRWIMQFTEGKADAAAFQLF